MSFNTLQTFVIATVTLAFATCVALYIINTDENLNPPIDTSLETSAPLVLDNECHASNVDDTQLYTLSLAHVIGAEIGYPETIQAISYVETKAGGYPIPVGNLGAPVGKRAYGIMQLKVSAARFVFKKYPDVFAEFFPPKTENSKPRVLNKIPDEEIIALLLTNDRANIMIGTLNFELMIRYTTNWSHAVTAYYTGLEGSRDVPVYQEHFYVLRIREALNAVVRPVNSCLGIS